MKLPASARTLLRLVLLVQCAALLAVAWALWRDGVPPWAALAAAFLAVALVRLAINMNNFAMAGRVNGTGSGVPPERRLGLRAWARMLAEEFGASMMTSSWHIPRGRARMAVYPDSAHVPVLLVHGYGCNSGFWARLTPLLDRAGISHAGVDLEPVAGSIDDYVPLIEAAVAALCAATGAPRVTIVAHSMGGLAARAWMRTHGDARLARLITLGTPHYGTALARFGPGENAVQMRRGSAWLRVLAASESAATRGRIVSIYTHHDNIVAPSDSGHLAGARNVALTGVGHVALGSNPRVLAEVLRQLPELHGEAA